MDNYCAPQWVDFTSSPQIPCDDYFEKFHDIYQPNIYDSISKNNIKVRKKICKITETPKKSMQLEIKDFIKSTPNLSENHKIEIDNLKNTPIKVIDPSRHSSAKHKVLQEVTYDNVLLEAIQNIQLTANLQKVTKNTHLESTENIFKKPLPLKSKTTKPVKIDAMHESSVSISSNEKETKNISSNVNMIKRNKNSSTEITKNDHPELKIGNKNIKLQSSAAKQQTSVIQTAESKKENRFNISAKTKMQSQHNHSLALLKKTTQKNMKVVNTNGLVKEKLLSRSCSSINQEKASSQKKTPFKNIVSTVVGNTGSEIIIKKEKVLFFDIPIHTNQKKVTRPVPFSFENRDKIKKQLKLDQESTNSKFQIIPNTKLVSECSITKKKGVTSLISNKIVNQKDKIIKQLKPNEKADKLYTQPVTMCKPMKITKALQDNKCKTTIDKIGKKQNEDTQNKNDINKNKNSLKFLPCKNIHVNKNSKIQTKETLQINKHVQKENKQPTVNVSTKANNILNQNKGIKLKSTAIKSNANLIEKKREFEKRMRQRRIMHEEKLKREREGKIAQEKAEIAKLRRQAEIKANPMPVYMPLVHVKSTKPLTQPQSPAWVSKHRGSRIKETS